MTSHTNWGQRTDVFTTVKFTFAGSSYRRSKSSSHKRKDHPAERSNSKFSSAQETTSRATRREIVCKYERAKSTAPLEFELCRLKTHIKVRSTVCTCFLRVPPSFYLHALIVVYVMDTPFLCTTPLFPAHVSKRQVRRPRSSAPVWRAGRVHVPAAPPRPIGLHNWPVMDSTRQRTPPSSRRYQFRLNLTIIDLKKYVIVVELQILKEYMKDDPSNNESMRLVAFLVDGLRWDYPFNDPELSEFQAMARDGARARYVTPDFPVKSFPNYYTIMTGLHTESHGMTGNYMHDVMRNTSFLLGTNPESYEPYWWEGAEPLWITATKQGRKVNMYYWPTCEVPIFNTLPNKCEPYVGYPTYRNITNSIDEIVQLFGERTIDMAFVYYEDVDRFGHAHGVESQQRVEATRDVDRFLEYLRENLRRTGQTEDVNVVVMSDHGMATVEFGPSGGYVPLSSYIDQNDLNNPVFYETSYVSMWPKEGRLDKDSVVTSRRLGSHAWDNALMDMKGVFMAVGPDFRAGFEGDSIHQVDVYQMMCEITAVSPRSHNGSALRIQGLLSNPIGGARTTSQVTWVTAAGFAVSLLFSKSY
uniref:glycerophosphocholine cholinephosphodiesterase n=1 Tax=Branchiostoma floridae TaxID=7739 RepID=C3ZMZ5_BRAFL|eukprot:XP_002590124.1 hypothetical protein BRAFLDRAFT_83404 [Branchiostoma floridae]